jgi:hypothetical protein
MDQVDGTASFIGDQGFLFLFNPNYKMLPAHIRLDASIGLKAGREFLLRELYPSDGKLIGKPGAGVWKYGDEVELKVDGTSANVLELVQVSRSTEIFVFGADSSDALNPARASLKNGVVRLLDVAGEPGSEQAVGVLLQDDTPLKEMKVNGKPVAFRQSGRYASANVKFAGRTFTHSQEVALQSSSNGTWSGSFVIPSRILQQLVRRRELWPIPWTKQDYDTTWLAPERLLLFVQLAEPDDKVEVKISLDGSPLELKRAYSSVREHSTSFVGFYADLSNIEPETPHTIRLTLPKLDPGRFKGIFFDNVEADYTEQLAP